MSEELDRFTYLADGFGARVAATPADAWNNTSPCEGWLARDVVKHVVNNFRGITATLEGGEPTPMADDDDPPTAWVSSYGAIKQALAAPGALDKTLAGPMGMQMPASQIIGRFVSTDVLVHTWDLARATGGDETLDADAVAAAYSGLKPMDAMIRVPGVFGPKVEAPEGADVQTEFLCFLGRTV
jgi:uncharacterized protein (TIGR03086 family)